MATLMRNLLDSLTSLDDADRIAAEILYAVAINDDLTDDRMEKATTLILCYSAGPEESKAMARNLRSLSENLFTRANGAS